MWAEWGEEPTGEPMKVLATRLRENLPSITPSQCKVTPQVTPQTKTATLRVAVTICFYWSRRGDFLGGVDREDRTSQGGLPHRPSTHLERRRTLAEQAVGYI